MKELDELLRVAEIEPYKYMDKVVSVASNNLKPLVEALEEFVDSGCTETCFMPPYTHTDDCSKHIADSRAKVVLTSLREAILKVRG